MTPEKKREHAYNVAAVISWQGEDITVTKASQLYGYYLAEGRVDICNELQAIISETKETIRKRYPEEQK